MHRAQRPEARRLGLQHARDAVLAERARRVHGQAGRLAHRHQVVRHAQHLHGGRFVGQVMRRRRCRGALPARRPASVRGVPMSWGADTPSTCAAAGFLVSGCGGACVSAPIHGYASEGRRGAGRAALRDAADLAERRDLEQLDAAFVQLTLLRTNALKSGASRQQRQSKVTHFLSTAPVGIPRGPAGLRGSREAGLLGVRRTGMGRSSTGGSWRCV